MPSMPFFALVFAKFKSAIYVVSFCLSLSARMFRRGLLI